MARFESLAEFEAGFPLLVADMLDAETDWNGTVADHHDHAIGPIGEALPDGTVELTSQLRKVLADAYEHRGDRSYFTPEQLYYVKTALKVTLHESIHLAGRPGRMDRPTAFALTESQKGIRALEEGVTELATRQLLNSYIDELGFDDIAPGIRRASFAPAYQDQVHVVSGLLDQVALDTGADRQMLIRELSIRNRAEKYEFLAGTIASSGAQVDLPASDIARQLRRNLMDADFPEYWPNLASPERYAQFAQDMGRIAMTDLYLSREHSSRTVARVALDGTATSREGVDGHTNVSAAIQQALQGKRDERQPISRGE